MSKKIVSHCNLSNRKHVFDFLYSKFKVPGNFPLDFVSGISRSQKWELSGKLTAKRLEVSDALVDPDSGFWRFQLSNENSFKFRTVLGLKVRYWLCIRSKKGKLWPRGQRQCHDGHRLWRWPLINVNHLRNPLKSGLSSLNLASKCTRLASFYWLIAHSLHFLQIIIFSPEAQLQLEFTSKTTS